MSRMLIALAAGVSRSWAPSGAVLTVLVLAAGSGCVTVDTPSTRVEVGPANLFHMGSGSSDSPAPGETAYAGTLRKVNRQQSKVAEELVKAEWDEVVEKSGKWAEYIRELNGQASTSHDPALFRQYCQELLTAIGAVQQAGVRRNYNECQRQLDACAVIINKINRAFPMTANEAMAAARRAERSPARDERGSPAQPAARGSVETGSTATARPIAP